MRRSSIAISILLAAVVAACSGADPTPPGDLAPLPAAAPSEVTPEALNDRCGGVCGAGTSCCAIAKQCCANTDACTRGGCTTREPW